MEWIGIRKHSLILENTRSTEVFEGKRKYNKVTLELFLTVDLNQIGEVNLPCKLEELRELHYPLKECIGSFMNQRMRQLFVRLNKSQKILWKNYTLTSNRSILLLRAKLGIRFYTSVWSIDFSYSLDTSGSMPRVSFYFWNNGSSLCQNYDPKTDLL